MKLGEALAQRAELQNRVNELKTRLAASALVQEGDSPPENPEELLAQFDRNCDELERLIAAINRTNTRAQLPSGLTVTEALARRDVLGIRHGPLRNCPEVATGGGSGQTLAGSTPASHSQPGTVTTASRTATAHHRALSVRGEGG